MQMKAEEIVSLTQKQQLVWLKNNVGDFAQRSADDPIGAWVYFDQFRYEDMINAPDSYDLGSSIQGRLPSMTNKRVDEINNGAKLNSDELKVVKRIVLENDWENDGGINASGFIHTLTNQETIYVSFCGRCNGQAGYNPSFYRIFRNREEAFAFFKKQGDFFQEI